MSELLNLGTEISAPNVALRYENLPNLPLSDSAYN